MYGPWSGHIGDALSKQSAIQGPHRLSRTHCPRDGTSETFCFGTHRSGTLYNVIKKDRRNEYLERGLQFHLLLVNKVTKMSHYKA
jgi:hypothetical protein